MTFKRNNPEKICFGCGKKIINKLIHAFHCKKCGRIIKDVNQQVRMFIYRTNLKKKYGGYTFRVRIDVIKKEIK